MIEIIIIGVVILFIVLYRANQGDNVYKFAVKKVSDAYGKYMPYSFQKVREKVAELGQDYSVKDYTMQVVIFGAVAAVISYFYFYNIIISIVYVIAAILIIPYLAYLKYKRLYSEFIFEQIQVYVTNTIMEFNTTNAFVKSLEGVVESGVLEDPVLSDVKMMIKLSYEKGDVQESIDYMNARYPFNIVLNMHQLFLQVTKEGAKDTAETFENMLTDIDGLVEGVYRDQMERSQFHKQFLTFGLALYSLIMVVQLVLGNESYLGMIDLWYVKIVVHGIILINSYFLLSGEKYYNENVGAE
ncbi:MAG: hypothetical protein Q4G04_00335 [bacterium]|nr:hypothetical protein [bacterium]